jgi:hypothetical protein
VLSVFLHDARGTSSEISAMVNGHKIFLPARSPQELAARSTCCHASQVLSESFLESIMTGYEIPGLRCVRKPINFRFIPN